MRVSKIIATAISLQLGLTSLGWGQETAPQMNEAARFFAQLAMQTDNPYIAAMARESASKLKDARLTPRTEVSLLTQPDNSMAVPTLINHKIMGTFVLDTGASYTVITPRMARKLGIEITPDTPRITLYTANGQVRAPKVLLNNVAIGGVQVAQVEAVVQDLGSDLLMAGLLGMNFFQGKKFSIQQNKLIIEG